MPGGNRRRRRGGQGKGQVGDQMNRNEEPVQVQVELQEGQVVECSGDDNKELQVQQQQSPLSSPPPKQEQQEVEGIPGCGNGDQGQGQGDNNEVQVQEELQRVEEGQLAGVAAAPVPPQQLEGGGNMAPSRRRRRNRGGRARQQGQGQGQVTNVQVGDHPPPDDPPPPPAPGPHPAVAPPPVRKTRSDEVRKMYLMYKCGNEGCRRKPWKSYHGWKATSVLFPESCWVCKEGVGRQINITEGMTWLDCFSCSGCDEQWYCVHPQEGQEQLYDDLMFCGNDCDPDKITLDGVQQRFCSIISYECRRTDCGRTWVTPYFRKEYTQKCRACRGNGIVLGSGYDQHDDSESGTTKKGPRFTGGGVHDVAGCDMCHELKPYKMTCKTSNRVHVDEFVAENGRITTVVSAIFSGRAARRPQAPP